MINRVSEKSSRERAIIAAEAANEKKAFNVTVLDVNEKSNVADYFMICTGNSTPQVHAIVQNIEEKLEELGEKVLRIEGYREGNWVLMDYGDLVVHVFRPETRDFYGLERLWGDSPVELKG